MSKAALIGSVHAPEQGVVVRGIHYPGGRFIPTNELRKAGVKPQPQPPQPDPVKGAAAVEPAKVKYSAGDDAIPRLWQQIEEAPHKTDAHGPLADALEERGDTDEAAFHRWVFETGHHPAKYHDAAKEYLRYYWHEPRFHHPGPHVPPHKIARRMMGLGRGLSATSYPYDSAEEAYDDLYSAWREAQAAQPRKYAAPRKPRQTKPTAGVQPSAPQPQPAAEPEADTQAWADTHTNQPTARAPEPEQTAAPNYGPHGYRALLDVFNHVQSDPKHPQARSDTPGGLTAQVPPQHVMADSRYTNFEEYLQHPVIGPWINGEYAAGRSLKDQEDVGHLDALVRHAGENPSIHAKMQSGEIQLHNLAQARQDADEAAWRSFKPIVRYVEKPEVIERAIYGHDDRPPLQHWDTTSPKTSSPIRPRAGRHVYFLRPDGSVIGYGRIRAAEDGGDHWKTRITFGKTPTHHDDDFGSAYAYGWEYAVGGGTPPQGKKPPSGDWAKTFAQLARDDYAHRRPYGHSAPGVAHDEHPDVANASAYWRAGASGNTKAGGSLAQAVIRRLQTNGHSVLLQEIGAPATTLGPNTPSAHRPIVADSVLEEARERWTQHLRTHHHATHDDLKRLVAQVTDEMYPPDAEPDEALARNVARRAPFWDHTKVDADHVKSHVLLRDFLETPEGQKTLAAMPAVLAAERAKTVPGMWHSKLRALMDNYYFNNHLDPARHALRAWLRQFPAIPYLGVSHDAGTGLVDYAIRQHEKLHAQPKAPPAGV